MMIRLSFGELLCCLVFGGSIYMSTQQVLPALMLGGVIAIAFSVNNQRKTK
jgi:hypothetical protein